jgi:hypothetical protein
MDDEALKLLRLESDLKQGINGRDNVLTAIAQRIWTSRANLDDPEKPIGVFLLTGPSSVGKTETARSGGSALGGEHNLITISMSSFQESHSVSKVKGAPPRYIGYGEEGPLSDAGRCRHQPEDRATHRGPASHRDPCCPGRSELPGTGSANAEGYYSPRPVGGSSPAYRGRACPYKSVIAPAAALYLERSEGPRELNPPLAL